MAKTTLKKYLKSDQDKREDKANAKVVGMPVSKFKKTAQAKQIDKAVVSLDNSKSKGKTQTKRKR